MTRGQNNPAGNVQEDWRPISGFEGRYEVSRDGQIRNAATGQALKQRLVKRYWTASAWNNGAVVLKVHREVCAAFHGPAPEGMDVCRHLDDNPSNNHVDNLAWGTRLDNAADAARNGRGGSGKLSAAQITAIAAAAKMGCPVGVLATLCRVDGSTISRVIDGAYGKPANESVLPIDERDSIAAAMFPQEWAETFRRAPSRWSRNRRSHLRLKALKLTEAPEPETPAPGLGWPTSYGFRGRGE